MSLYLKEYNYWKPANEQSNLNVREYICVAKWRWKTIFIKEATQEVAEKLENWKHAAYQEEKTEQQRRWSEEFPSQHDQESRTVSHVERSSTKITRTIGICWRLKKSSMILTHRAVMTVPTILIKLLLPRVQESLAAKLECCYIHERNMSIPGTVFDCQRARRNPDELHDDSSNFATSSAILKTEGIEKREIEEPLQTLPSPCFWVRARQKSPDDRNCLMSIWPTMPWVLGLVLKVAWQFRVISPRRCICKHCLTKRNFNAGSWSFRADVCAKTKNLALTLQ